MSRATSYPIRNRLVLPWFLFIWPMFTIAYLAGISKGSKARRVDMAGLGVMNREVGKVCQWLIQL